MTEIISQPGPDGGDLDLVAVHRDAELVDLLSRRGPVPSDDRVLTLLAAFAADIDAGLDALLVAQDDDVLVRAASTVVPDLPATTRGHGLRVTTVAIVVGATLSLGGVAAAVTGDPLAPVKGLYSAATGGLSEHHPGKDAAFDAAKQAQRQIRSGNLAGARASLAAMKKELERTDLSAGDRRAIEARIAALEGQLERAEAAQAATGGGGQGKGQDNGQGPDENNGKAKDPAAGTDRSGQGGQATDRPTTGPQSTRTKPADAPAAAPEDDDAQTGPTRPRPTQAGGGGQTRGGGSTSESSSDDAEDDPGSTATSAPEDSDSAGADDQGSTGSGKARTGGGRQARQTVTSTAG